MDIVYVLRKWPMNSIELLYSLRSLENIEHWKVFIVWYRPNWIRNVIHIPAEDNLWSKYKNVMNKYNIICNDDRISDDFIFMNDDIYIIEKTEDLPYYTKWTLKAHLDYITGTVWNTKYYEVIDKVYNIFPEWYSFNVHCPIVYNKEKLKDLIEVYIDDEISIRSLYWNTYIKEHIPFWEWEISDCKIKDGYDWIDNKFLSSNDISAKSNEFIGKLQGKFPNESIYEYNFNPLYRETMKFTATPMYCISLSKLVRFNHKWEFYTNDEKLIEELKMVKKISMTEEKTTKTEEKKDKVVVDTTKTKEQPSESKTEQWELEKIDDIKVVRQIYKEKFGKKAFPWWDIETLKQKLA